LNGLLYFYELVDGKAKIHSPHYNTSNVDQFFSAGLGLDPSISLSFSAGENNPFSVNVWEDLGFQNQIISSINFTEPVKLSSLGLEKDGFNNVGYYLYDSASEKLKCEEYDTVTGNLLGNCTIYQSRVFSQIEEFLYTDSTTTQGALQFYIQPSQNCVGHSSVKFLVHVSGFVENELGDLINVEESTNPGEITVSSQVIHPNTPNDEDADGLGYSDEITYNTSPTMSDTDGDGLNDGNEFNYHGTNPLVADTDGDGLDDGYEISSSLTNPNSIDTDDDSLGDSDEISGNNWNGYITDPNDSDTDDDGLDDGYELMMMTDPTVNESNNNQSNPPNIVKIGRAHV
jgi:hypothetical protein